jgi:hypothetical protein
MSKKTSGQGSRQRDRISTIVCLANHLNIAAILQKLTDALTNKMMVFSHDDSNHNDTLSIAHGER